MYVSSTRLILVNCWYAILELSCEWLVFSQSHRHRHRLSSVSLLRVSEMLFKIVLIERFNLVIFCFLCSIRTRRLDDIPVYVAQVGRESIIFNLG